MCLLEAFGIGVVSTSEGLGELLCEGLVLTELGEDGLVNEVLDILGLIEGQ